ncbi:hypothetical protein VNO80_03074 [Phaseolus coccineus]|uniref:Uncharacterized protein n=1 Tax=Phaseolus coccineus TaxID=3886 RepID=A0AAN9RIH2_PHACN
MGCGMSRLDPEDAALDQCENVLGGVMPPPFDKGELLHGNSNSNNNKDVAMVMKSMGDEEAKDKEGSNGERLKEKSDVGRKDRAIGGKEKHSSGDNKYCAKKNAEDELEYRDDNLTAGPGSPSFREYCNDYDCGDRSSMEYSNDIDSMESIKNGSEASLIRNNKPMNQGSVDSSKEKVKKEGRELGFRNVISKGKTRRGGRNLLNFACYSGSNESRAEGSSNKIVAKTEY